MNTRHSSTAAVTLREVTRDTLSEILELEVAPSQSRFVAPNAVSIAEAYFEKKAWFRGIYADDTAVGFIMNYEDLEKSSFYLWRYMIAEKHQGQGYGLQALTLTIERIKAIPNASEITLSLIPGRGSPIPFYEKLGFVDTGEVEDGERVFRLQFQPKTQEQTI